MSRSAAPSALVTTAIRRGKAGNGRLRAGSSSPSSSSAFLARSNWSCHRPPAAVGSSSVTVSRNSPRSSHTVGRASMKTSAPSSGGPGRRSLSERHMTQRTCACASRRVKYQWPLLYALNPLTSPWTHTRRKPASTSSLAFRVTSRTLSAPSAVPDGPESKRSSPPTGAWPARCCTAAS